MEALNFPTNTVLNSSLNWIEYYFNESINLVLLLVGMMLAFTFVMFFLKQIVKFIRYIF